MMMMMSRWRMEVRALALFLLSSLVLFGCQAFLATTNILSRTRLGVNTRSYTPSWMMNRQPPPLLLSASGQQELPTTPVITTSTTTTISVTPSDSRLPVDLLLVKHISGLSRRGGRRLLQEGKVRLDGKVVRRFIKARPGQSLVVELDGSVVAASSQDDNDLDSLQAQGPLDIKPEKMDLSVLYEDDYLLAVDKPVGRICHPVESCTTGTLVNGIMHMLNYTSGSNATQGVVHRLDKATSGVWVFAKTREAASRLSKIFQTRKVNKAYLAVCVGYPGRNKTVETPIFRKPNGKMAAPTTREEYEKAKAAKSVVNAVVGDDRLSLVHVRIMTGRTHQIRVHLNELGAPVLGDPLYCKRETTVKMGVQRMLLHAYSLEFPHPITNKPLRITAPAPSDMLIFANYLVGVRKPTPRKPPMYGGDDDDDDDDYYNYSMKGGTQEVSPHALLNALKEGRPIDF